MRMEEIKKELENLSIEELQSITVYIRKLIQQKRESLGEYEFNIDIVIDSRKGKPYVALLTLKDGKIEREFYELNKTYGKKTIRLFGSIKAKEGNIIEMREGASWKNDYRNVYVVDEGKLHYIGRVNDITLKAVYEYLLGKISKEQLKQLSEQN